MNQVREYWGSRLGFILAAAGSAIGLGSLWRFPYVAGANGGGAFVLLYIIFTFLIGVPVFIGSLIIGRRSQKSAVAAYSELCPKHHSWSMIGWLNVLSTFIILSYYCVVAGWCLNYALMSINQFAVGKSPEQIKNVFQTVFASPGINVFWLFIYVLLNVGVLMGGVRKGIEWWSRILMPGLFVILIALFFYSMTMEGFPQAFHFIFDPNFSKLTPSVILNALGMSFFTLSVGLGILVTYGSYMKSSEDIPKTGIIVALMTLFVSLLAALMIYPIVFTFNFPAEGGPGLVFQTMPVLFAKLPGNLVLSTVFFVLFIFAALTSSISLLEVLVANLMEKMHWTRKKALLIASSAVFIFALPTALAGSKELFPQWETIYGKNFFDTMNYITASWTMPIGGLLTTIFVGFVMDKKIIKEEFQSGSSLAKFYSLWYFFIKWVAPLAVLCIIFQEAGILNFSWLISLF